MQPHFSLQRFGAAWGFGLQPHLMRTGILITEATKRLGRCRATFVPSISSPEEAAPRFLI